MDLSSVSSYLNTTASNAASSSNAAAATDSIKGISSKSTKEEVEAAAKSFESYFVEQAIKEVKKSIDSINGDDEDSTVSMYSDFYLDSTIQKLSEELVDQLGDSFTKTMVENMTRTYGIGTEDADAAENEATDAEVADDITAETAVSTELDSE